MTPWILLRGLAREGRHWGDFTRVFEGAFRDSKVVVLDIPGNGSRNAETSPVTIDGMVEACRRQLASMDVKPPYGLLAISLGGMISVQWSVTYPQEVQAQVLINTSMRPFSPFYRRLQPRNYFTVLRLLSAGEDAVVREAHILRMTTRNPHSGVVSEWVRIQVDRPVSRVNAARQLLAAARFKAPLAAPLTRTLVLASERDGLVSFQCSVAISKQWDCCLYLHQTAGHDLPLDDPVWVVGQVERWYRDQPLEA
jgi:pimeloyl-ACP methyl ester carboxylesterase